MTEPDAELRLALRDLIPGYTGPVDPVPQIAARVRRRRRIRRRKLAIGATGLTAVLALLVPALLLPAPGGLTAAYPGESAPPVPAPSGSPPPPAPEPSVFPVASGVAGGARWTIGSTTISPGARRCLRSDGAAFARDIACFDDWTAGSPVTWVAQSVTGSRSAVTWIAGVSPAPVVRIRLADGRAATVPARHTATDRAARFFGLVVTGTVEVRDVTPLDAAGHPLGPPVRDPGSACRPGPSVACGTTEPDPTPSPTR